MNTSVGPTSYGDFSKEALVPETDHQRRRVLTAAVTGIGVAGATAVASVFVRSMNPSARAIASGGPVDIDISKLEPGQQLTVVWRQKPVWVLRRSEEILQSLQEHNALLRDPLSEVSEQQPVYAQNAHRSIRPDIFVVISLCTHLGCIPSFRPELEPADMGDSWDGGYFCPCHGSKFDLAGRVFRGVPAPTNLVVPPHEFLSESLLRIGSDAT